MTETLSRNGFYVYAGARKADDLEMLDAMENVSAVQPDVTDDGQAAITIRFAMQRLLQSNENQPYSYSRDELVALMDELLKANWPVC